MISDDMSRAEISPALGIRECSADQKKSSLADSDPANPAVSE